MGTLARPALVLKGGRARVPILRQVASLAMALREQLAHPFTAREFRVVALGSQSQLAEQVFGLLIRAIAFSRRDEMLEVVVSQGIGQRGVTLQLVSRVRGEDELATGLRNIEPTRTTRFDATEQQEPIASERLLPSIR